MKSRLIDFVAGRKVNSAGWGVGPGLWAGLFLASSLFPAPVALAEPHATQADDRPNIIIIMADDMGFSDIGCYGGEVKTPNLDRLAAGGLRFTQFYNTARCCPTRAALLTGLYSHQAGVGGMVNDRGSDGYRGRLNDSCATIGEVLRPAGYRTMVAGKWHVTPFNYETNTASDPTTWPLQRGFDWFYGSIAGGGSFFYPHGLFRGNDQIEPPATGYYYTDAISDEAAAMVERASTEDRPFMMYVAYTAPHWPLHALPEDIAKYEGAYDVGWDEIRRTRLQRMREMGLIDEDWELTDRDSRVKPWEETQNREWNAHRMEVYAAQIDRMDQGIGRIVQAVKQAGRLDNTLIMFLADNGACAENLGKRWGGERRRAYMEQFLPSGGPLRAGNDPAIEPGPADTFASYGVGWANASNTPFRLYKHFVHEGGIASPLIVHWPAGMRDVDDLGSFRSQQGHVIDLMATCVDVSGAEYPPQIASRTIQPLEGRSLVPTFTNREIDREAIFWEHGGNHAIRVGDWKLVARGRNGTWELYDLKSDRTETNNLAEEHPDLVSQLSEQWEAWAHRCKVKPWPK